MEPGAGKTFGHQAFKIGRWDARSKDPRSSHASHAVPSLSCKTGRIGSTTDLPHFSACQLLGVLSAEECEKVDASQQVGDGKHKFHAELAPWLPAGYQAVEWVAAGVWNTNILRLSGDI